MSGPATTPPPSPRWRRRLAVGLLVLALLHAAAFWGASAFLARSLAPRSGEQRLPGLSAPVAVSFDARGVPRVRARTDADALLALGMLHASERLFQMELVRRLARGELAELFGEALVETDVTQRRLGFARKAAHDAASLSPAARAALTHYVAGINAWIAQAPLLPPELVVLRLRPRAWTPEDCLAVALYQTWFSHELMDQDATYQLLVEKAGPGALPAIHGAYPWSPPTIPDSDPQALFSGERFPLRSTTASNSWAIGPSRTASGKAIHAADPHLAIDQAPGLWFLVGLHSEEGLDVAGVTQPGLPFVVMGHNAAISFAFTVASVDLIDTYDEELLPGPPRRVATASGPRDLETFREEIRVKGEPAPRVVTVERTAHGPLVETRGGRGVSLHWAGFDLSAAELADAALRLQRARGFDDFRRAVTRFGALDANWVYADRDGHVGYQLGAPVPLRDVKDTFVRQRGADPAADWKGFRPLDGTPHALDPPSGFVASCNNQPVGPSWPYPIPGFYDPYRIVRATALLSSSSSWTPERAGRMQLDLVSQAAVRWKGLCADGAARIGQTAAAESLRQWDGEVGEGSAPAALFELCWAELGRALFEDELGASWKKGTAVQERVLSEPDSPLVDDRRTPHVETKVEIAARAMERAISLARGRTWGELSTLTIRHPLSRVALLDRWLGLSRGPFPAPGDFATLDASFTRFDEKTGRFSSRVGPSMRFVLDWADVDGFSIALALGQSGNPLDPHYDDFLAPSRRGERWVLPFSREREAATEASRLTLVP